MSEQIEPVEFFEDLLKSKSFCEKLGRLILLSGKLESLLKRLIKESGIKLNRNSLGYVFEKGTLGQLTETCKENKLIADDGLAEVLKFISERRNYLTHNSYSLFNEEIPPSLLPNKNLQSDDAELYFPRAIDDVLSYVDNAISRIMSACC